MATLTVKAVPASVESKCELCGKGITVPLNPMLSAALMAVNGAQIEFSDAHLVCPSCLKLVNHDG